MRGYTYGFGPPKVSGNIIIRTWPKVSGTDREFVDLGHGPIGHFELFQPSLQ